MAHDPGRAGPPVTDPAVADLVSRYVAQGRSTLGRLLVRLGTRLAEDDFAAIATVGRDLAGSGEAFGFPRISALGRNLVDAAEAANEAAVMRYVHELQAYLDSLAPAGESVNPRD